MPGRKEPSGSGGFRIELLQAVEDVPRRQVRHLAGAVDCRQQNAVHGRDGELGHDAGPSRWPTVVVRLYLHPYARQMVGDNRMRYVTLFLLLTTLSPLAAQEARVLKVPLRLGRRRRLFAGQSLAGHGGGRSRRSPHGLDAAEKPARFEGARQPRRRPGVFAGRQAPRHARATIIPSASGSWTVTNQPSSSWPAIAASLWRLRFRRMVSSTRS